MSRLLTFSLFAVSMFAGDWARFRGPDGAGIQEGAALPQTLDPSGALWTAQAPQGASSPVSNGEKVFITGFDGSDRIVVCYSASNGKTLWTRKIARARTEFFHSMHGPATPTPVIAAERLIALFPETGLAAFDLDGKELWRTPVEPSHSIQGYAASPVAAGELVIVLVDSPEAAHVTAYDTSTGKQKWRTERPRGVLGGYATPVVWRDNDGSTQVIVAGAGELTGYSAATGERLWWGPGMTSYAMASPYVAGDSVYTSEPLGVSWPPFSDPLGRFDKDKDGKVSLVEAKDDASWLGSLLGIDRNSGDNDGFVTAEEYAKATASEDGGMYRVRLGGRKDISTSRVLWRNTRGVPSHSAPLLYGKTLYTVRRGIVSALDNETGSVLREARLPNALGDYYASPVAGDGKIYFASFEGVVSVIEAGVPWRVLSTADFGEPILATPAIADGRVFVRTQKRLLCFGQR